MNLRRFNSRGIAKMQSLLDSYSGNGNPFSDAMLIDPELTDLAAVGVEVERPGFERRFDMAAYSHALLGLAGMTEPQTDKGLWAWLAALWFEDLAPPRRDGRRTPGDRARWIPALDEARRYYRHLVLGPYLIYRRYAGAPQQALALLVQHPSAPGDVVEQLASRPDVVNCPAAVGVATALYCDGEYAVKKGAGGKKPGSARRLGDVLMQFDLTYDLQSLTPEQLMLLLPGEFGRWKDGGSGEAADAGEGRRGRSRRGLLGFVRELVGQ